MRSLLLIAALIALPALASAQDSDAEDVVEDVASVRVHVERPPEGSLRRGLLPAPGWLVYLCGGLVAASAAGALAYRIARSRKR